MNRQLAEQRPQQHLVGTDDRSPEGSLQPLEIGGDPEAVAAEEHGLRVVTDVLQDPLGDVLHLDPGRVVG